MMGEVLIAKRMGSSGEGIDSKLNETKTGSGW